MYNLCLDMLPKKGTDLETKTPNHTRSTFCFKTPSVTPLSFNDNTGTKKGLLHPQLRNLSEVALEPLKMKALRSLT